MTGGRWLGGIQRQVWARLLSPFVGQTLGSFVASENGADLRVLGELIGDGRVVAPVDRVFPLAGTVDAIRYFLDGRARGKVMIAVRPDAHAG
jgi:NADPH:quinone reductase-like Zn-dependent oxidoreductase